MEIEPEPAKTPEEMPKTPAIQRDERGRLKPGSQLGALGKGTKKYTRIELDIPQHKARLWESFVGAITPAHMERIALAMVKKAEAGDVKAATMICDRVYGRPIQTVDASIIAEQTTTFVNSLMLDDSIDRKTFISSIINSRLAGGVEAPQTCLPAPAPVQNDPPKV